MMKILKNFFGKRDETVRFSYEEKRYPLGVLVLVFLMTALVWMLGQRALADVSDGIAEIPYPQYYELPAYEEAQRYWDEIVNPLQQKKWQLESRLHEVRGEYDSTLLENIADEPERLYGDEKDVRTDFRQVSAELAEVSAELQKAEAEHKRLSELAEEASKPIYHEYRRKMQWRQAKVFAWEALFWVPFFFLTLGWHTASKRKESKWEIISLASLIAASLLALQSICVLLWSWIPRELLEWIWELLRATLFTRIIGYYLIVGVVILLFGAFIVFVHRRMTDPVRGGRRKIRQGYCPTCSYPLRLSHRFCGGCSKELMKDCPSCKKERYTWEAVCTHCGSK